MSKHKILHVVKIGGNIINNEEKLFDFLSRFSKIPYPKILVHGGGKLATEISDNLNVKTKMINGRRITDKQSLKIVTMVYAGLINKKIVSILQSYNCNAIGLSGADANIIKSTQRHSEPLDYGFVGDITNVKSDIIEIFLKGSMVPVFCAITHNKKGQLLNTNADTIASEIAIAMSPFYQTDLLYCFEKKGVLMDINDDNSVIGNINKRTYQSLKEKGFISEGMLPKLENCFNAIEKGVSKVIIGSKNIIDTHQTFGTTISL